MNNKYLVIGLVVVIILGGFYFLNKADASVVVETPSDWIKVKNNKVADDWGIVAHYNHDLEELGGLAGRFEVREVPSSTDFYGEMNVVDSGEIFIDGVRGEYRILETEASSTVIDSDTGRVIQPKQSAGERVSVQALVSINGTRYRIEHSVIKDYYLDNKEEMFNRIRSIEFN